MGKRSTLMISLICILSMCLPIQVWANTDSISKSDSAETNFYEEKGQIDLDNITFSLGKSGKLKIKGNDIITEDKVLKELSESEKLTTLLEDAVGEGKTPVAIGYTRVYLKEVVDEKDEKHLEPITVAEVAAGELKGEKESRGNLTLYTTAFATSSGITAKSIADWGTGAYVPGSNSPAGYDDYISVATDDAYIVNNSSFTGKLVGMSTTLPSKWYSKCDESNSSVVYRFREYDSTAFQVSKATVTMNCGKNETSGNKLPTTIKSISKYVHTWGATTVGITFSKNGPSFTLSPTTKAWQISSSVNVPKK